MKHGGYGRSTLGLHLSQSRGIYGARFNLQGKVLLSSTTSRGRATGLGPAGGARNWAPVVRKDAGGWPSSPHGCMSSTINTAHNMALQGWAPGLRPAGEPGHRAAGAREHHRQGHGQAGKERPLAAGRGRGAESPAPRSEHAGGLRRGGGGKKMRLV